MNAFTNQFLATQPYYQPHHDRTMTGVSSPAYSAGSSALPDLVMDEPVINDFSDLFDFESAAEGDADVEVSSPYCSARTRFRARANLTFSRSIPQRPSHQITLPHRSLPPTIPLRDRHHLIPLGLASLIYKSRKNQWTSVSDTTQTT